MVVINTKKIFITILVSALLLVGSALTVFASDFEFSAPNYNDSDIYFTDYESVCYVMFNYINIDDDEQRYFEYVGSFMAYYNNNTEVTTKKFVLTLSQYGFEFLSQNGVNAQSMKAVLDDFIAGNVGNITVTWGRFAPMNYYIFDSGESNLQWDYQETPQYFDVITDLNHQFFNYESQYNNVLRSYDLLLESYTNLNNNYQTLQTNYTNLQADYNYINNEFESLTNSYNELDTQYRELVTQYSYYKNAYENSLIDIESLESTVSNMETVISQLETIVSQLETELETSYMSGYTAAIEEIDAFESGIYTIFSSPFVLVGELSQIEIFGASITKIVGIILLFIILSVVLAFLWKVIPFV